MPNGAADDVEPCLRSPPRGQPPSPRRDVRPPRPPLAIPGTKIAGHGPRAAAAGRHAGQQRNARGDHSSMPIPTRPVAGGGATRRAALAGLGAAALAAPAIRPSFAQGAPIKVGVLHSLSGTMAISETALRDTVLMMVEWINGRGGLLGRRDEEAGVEPAPPSLVFGEKVGGVLH